MLVRLATSNAPLASGAEGQLEAIQVTCILVAWVFRSWPLKIALDVLKTEAISSLILMKTRKCERLNSRVINSTDPVTTKVADVPEKSKDRDASTHSNGNPFPLRSAPDESQRAIDSQCHQYSARFDNVAVKRIFCPGRLRRRKHFGALGRIQLFVEVIQVHRRRPILLDLNAL